MAAMQDGDDAFDQNEILIQLVEGHPNLCNKSLTAYKDNDQRRRSLQKIADKMFQLTESRTTVKHIVTRWKLLYRRYHQEYKKEKKYIQSGSAAPENEPPTWKYYDLMGFLEQHIQHTKTASNFKLGGDDDDWETDESDVDNDYIEHGDDQQYVHATSAHEINSNAPNEIESVDNAENVRPVDDYDNDYMLIFRYAWQNIPEQHRQNCFFKLRKMIRNKKKGLHVHD